MELEMPRKKEKKAKIAEQERREKEIKTKLVKLDYSFGELAKIIPKSNDGTYPYEESKIREKLMMHLQLEEGELNEELKKDFEKCVDQVYSTLLSFTDKRNWPTLEFYHPDISKDLHQLVTKKIAIKIGDKGIDLEHGQFAKMVSKSATGSFEHSDIKKALLKHLEMQENSLSFEVKKKLEAYTKNLCEVMNHPALSKGKEKIKMKLPLELVYQSKLKSQPDKIAETIFEKHGTTEQARLLYFKKMYDTLKLYEDISEFDPKDLLESEDLSESVQFKMSMTQFEEMLPKSEGGFYHESQIMEILIEYLKFNKTIINDVLQDLLEKQVQLIHFNLNCEKHLKCGFAKDEECYINSQLKHFFTQSMCASAVGGLVNWDGLKECALKEFLEKYLDKLTTKECFGIAQHCFTSDLPVSLLKKPSQLKNRIMVKAESDSLSLENMIYQSGKALRSVYEMFDSMKDLSRTELVEVKKALGMSANDTHSRTTLKNIIVNNLRISNAYGQGSKTLKEIIDRIRSKRPEKMELDETHDVEMTEAESGENSAAFHFSLKPENNKPISIDDVMTQLDALPNDMVKDIAVDLKVKASASLLKRPKDLKEKIRGVIVKDQSLLKRCHNLCSDQITRNSELETLAKESTRSELYEICKFLKIDVEAHSSKGTLASKVKEFMKSNNISLLQLVQDMNERNLNVGKMSDFLNTLPRSRLFTLRDQLQSSSKGNKSAAELKSTITKCATKKGLLKEDLEKMLKKTEADTKKLEKFVLKDLSILGYEVLVQILQHIAPDKEIPPTDPFDNGRIRDYIFEEMKMNEECMKLVAVFLDYNHFTLNSHLSTLSEMDLDFLRETIFDLGLEVPIYQDRLVYNPAIAVEARDCMTFKIIHHYRKVLFQDFIKFYKPEKVSFSLDYYFKEFEARHQSKPEWTKLRVTNLPCLPTDWLLS